MIGQLSEYGYNIVNTPDQADLILINSCTVKNPSQDAFLSMVSKARKIKKPVVVAGCVPQGDQNIPELSEISALGVTQIDRVVEVVEETLKGHKVQLMDKKALPSLDLPKIRKNKDIEMYFSFYLVFLLMLAVWEHVHIVKLCLLEENFFHMLLMQSPQEFQQLFQKVLRKFGLLPKTQVHTEETSTLTFPSS